MSFERKHLSGPRIWIEHWNQRLLSLVFVTMSRSGVWVLSLIVVGCHSRTESAISTAPLPKSTPTVDHPRYSLQDLAGSWKVDLSMPPARFQTELMADGTYKGNNRTGKWGIEGDQIVLKGFNGGTDYTMRITDNKHLNGPMDGFRFSR